MEESHHINITLLGKPYNFKSVYPDDEIDLRAAANALNKKMDHYKQKFAELKDIDILAISSLTTLAFMMKEKRNNSAKDFIADVRVLDEKLGEYIETIIKEKV